MGSFHDYVERLDQSIRLISNESILALKGEMLSRIEQGGSIYFMGNGGSMANCMHIVGDYTKSFGSYDQKCKFICLGADLCYLSAYSNDYDFNNAFASLVRSYVSSEDLIILLSGSGNSVNMVKALQQAKEIGVTSASITGFSGGYLKKHSTISIHVPIEDMEIAEDAQAIIFHYLKQILLDATSSRMSSMSDKYTKRTTLGQIS